LIKVTQEVNAKTRISATDLTQHITQTDSDIQALRQEVAQVKQQVAKGIGDEMKVISDAMANCNSQIVAPGHLNQ
jgi:uncharacterized membrane protein YukC